MDPISTASAGLLKAYARYDQANQAVVQATTAGSQSQAQISLPAAIVGQIGAKAAVQASTKVLQASDEMFKATLDILV